MANRFLNNIKINDSYELPPADGTENQIIVTDGAGNLSFNDLSAVSGAVEGVQSDILYYEVKNSTGTTIETFKGVMAVGTDGNSGHILIDEMVADGTVEARYFLGVTQAAIPNGGIGRVIAFGEIDQVNTNAFPDGTVLWCDPANPGDFTATEPDGPSLKIPAAFVLNQATNGKIQVRVQGNEGIKDLYDTKITSQVDGDVLVWDNTTGVWFNDSTLNVDYTNSRVGIGTTDPAANLHIFDLNTSSSDIFKIQQQFVDILGFPLGISDTFTINNSGDVGINIASPSAKLQIEAPSGDFLKITESGEDRLTLDSNNEMVLTAPSDWGGYFKVGKNVGTSEVAVELGEGRTGNGFSRIDLIGDTTYTDYGFRIIRNNSGANTTSQLVHRGTGNFELVSTDNGDIILNPGDGYVGIGITNPEQKLHVAGNMRLENQLYDSTNSQGSFGQILSKVSAGTQWIDGSAIPGVPDGSGTANYTARWTDTDTLGTGVLYDNGTDVGIGEDNPGAKLDVAGEGRFTERVYTNANGTNTVGILGKASANGWASRYDSNNSNFSGFYFDTNHQSIILGRDSSGNIVNYIHASGGSYFKGGNVGIGNDNPSYLLDINEDDNAVALRVTGGGGGAAMATFVRDVGSTGSQVNINAQSNFPQIQFVNTGNTFSIGGDTSGNFKISDNTSIGTNDRITIDSAGSVGIGVSGPGTKLDVAGNARFTGEINMEEDHYINLRFEVPDNDNTEQYILLCRYAANNDVNGTITMDRTSGLRHACSVDIILSAGVSALPVGGLRAIGTSGAGNPEYNLVTCYLDGVQYVALKIENPDNYYESTGAYFTGRIKSTGVKLVPKLASELTSIVDFEINTLHTFSGDAFFRDGNVEILETAAQTPADKFVVLDSGVLKYRTGSEVLSDIGGTDGSDSLQLIDVSEPGNTTAEWSLIKTLPASTTSTRDTLFIKVVGGSWNEEGRYEAEITLSNRDNFNYFWEVKGGDGYNIGANGSNRLRVVAYSQQDNTVDVYLYKAGYMTGYIYATFQNTGGPEIITSLGSPTTTQPPGTEVFSTHGETYAANISSVNGKVGINAAYPGKMLELRGGANEAAIRLRDTESNVWDIQNSTLGKLDFIRGGSSTYMRIDQLGNVGINQTNPGGRLEVRQDANNGALTAFTSPHIKLTASATADNQGFVGITAATSTSDNYGYSFGAQRTAGGVGDFKINYHNNSAQGTNRFLIDQNGHVGVGATNPSFLLDIGDSRNDNDVFRVNGLYADVLFSGNVTAPTGGVGLWNFINTGTNATTRFYVQDANNANERLTFRFTGNGGSNEILSGTSLGRVGIGTTSPNAKLHISSGTADEDCVVIIESDTDNNDEASNPRLELRQDAGAVIGRLGYRNDTNSLELINQYGEALYLGTSNSTDLTILSNGNVGIGMTTPQAKLHVQNYTTGESHQAMFKGGAVNVGDYSYISLNNGYSTEYNKEVRLAAVSEQSNANKTGFAIFTSPDANGASGHERLRVTADGDVGIGTDNPNHELVVQGTSSPNIELKNSNYSNGGFVLNRTNYTQQWKWWAESNQMYFSFATDESTYSAKMTIQSDGDVGIGTPSPGEKLDVAGNIKSTGSIYTGYNPGVPNSISCSNWFRTNGTTGIFFASYLGGLYMTDTTYVRLYNSKALQVDNTGTSSIRAAGDIVAYYSDERLKTNLGNITNAVDKVKKLNGFYYKNNELANSFGYTEDHLQVGVSAQEVEAIMPEVVKPAPFDLKNKENGESYSASGENYKTVKYEKLVPLLIEAIKEQQKQIDELKNQLDAFTK